MAHTITITIDYDAQRARAEFLEDRYPEPYVIAADYDPGAMAWRLTDDSNAVSTVHETWAEAETAFRKAVALAVEDAEEAAEGDDHASGDNIRPDR